MSALITSTTPTRDSLPALVENAGQRLIAAKDSAEVLEAKKLAEFALHYARVTKAANETHADCLRIITRAEMRMADEVDRGQKAGEVQRAHRPITVRAADSYRPMTPRIHLNNEATWPGGMKAAQPSATLSDLGVSRQRLSEWREIRDAGPAVVEEALATALAEERAPTKSDIIQHVRGTFGTGDNEWFTPRQYIEAARAVMGGIDLDPATQAVAQRTVQAERFFTREDDALTKPWDAERVWLNPPYAQPFIRQFIDKLVVEIETANVREAILLTHNYTDTAWFHAAEAAANLICFTRGRIKFIDADGRECAPTQGQAFFYFGDNSDTFRKIFGQFGFVR